MKVKFFLCEKCIIKFRTKYWNIKQLKFYDFIKLWSVIKLALKKFLQKQLIKNLVSSYIFNFNSKTNCRQKILYLFVRFFWLVFLMIHWKIMCCCCLLGRKVYDESWNAYRGNFVLINLFSKAMNEFTECVNEFLSKNEFLWMKMHESSLKVEI